MSKEIMKTIKDELKIYEVLTSSVLKSGFVFTYPELTKQKFPEYFVL